MSAVTSTTVFEKTVEPQMQMFYLSVHICACFIFITNMLLYPFYSIYCLQTKNNNALHPGGSELEQLSHVCKFVCLLRDDKTFDQSGIVL